jgi:hypothetical protein
VGKETLIREFFPQRERILQACWAHRLWAGSRLATSDGLPLAVEFPGWLNRGPGPDFTEARIRIGDAEHFGDVEIHVDEGNWRAHRHHQDPAFRRVVLHVVLEKGAGGVAEGPGGKGIPVFEALPHLSGQVVEVMGEPEAMLRQYEGLPGRCGLRAALAEAKVVNEVIAHAAEVRARQKADRIVPDFGLKPDGQILYELVFQSLGYRPYAELFRALAVRFPLKELERFLLLSSGEARKEVLSRWFGALGLLEGEGAGAASGEAHDEFERLRSRWRSLGEAPLATPLKRGGSRPWNSPERRMVGMFHHLHALAPKGWLKEWLAFLRALDELRDEPDLRKAALGRLEEIFATPVGEPWRRRVSFSRPPLPREARMIGADRMIIVMANAVLPFFLAYARHRGEPELERLLYRLFIVLPPEAPNQRTRFMERRMMVLSALTRTLRMHQGLLQIHEDFCTSFYEGCEQCRFPELIALPEQDAG